MAFCGSPPTSAHGEVTKLLRRIIYLFRQRDGSQEFLFRFFEFFEGEN
uniref:Uncharacterized protein n=1 Tax=Anguilla anguilla TaxID=7936 RepID=A0A0E9W5H5_ANGAN